MRIFSGIQPTGAKHLGNYIGAIRNYVALQEKGDAFFCIVDLHSITSDYDPDDLRESTLALAALLFAAGLDPERSTVFAQSHVTAHPEAAWLLGSVTSYGELRRMTQFKDKREQQDFASSGLFTYPVLQAADILLYQTDLVPIGEDQRQHLELSRNVAERFNSRFGETFRLPDAMIPEVGGRIMDLQEPERKMSTTGGTAQGTVGVLDPPETIRKKFKSAVTDSGTDVRHDPEQKAGVSNLIEIMAIATGNEIPEIEARFDGGGYGAFKQEVGEAVVALFEPIRAALRGAALRPGRARAPARRRRREGPRGVRPHARADVRAHGLRPGARTTAAPPKRGRSHLASSSGPSGRRTRSRACSSRHRACRAARGRSAARSSTAPSSCRTRCGRRRTGPSGAARARAPESAFRGPTGRAGRCCCPGPAAGRDPTGRRTRRR